MKFGDQVISHFKASTLSFTQNPSEHYDVFFSSGAIQYVEQYRSLLHTLLHKNTGGGGGAKCAASRSISGIARSLCLHNHLQR
ncbi:hypothetical protein [Helicobacter canis]|uniref:hypothetical protein n=1 Tax=Helicobacter canis TaxID=29419 RepID=UPI001B33F5E4|nr:hypothetical protein [Helicobacter canis]